MPLTLIEGLPTEKRSPAGSGAILNIAELFCNTVQGENFSGIPATFMRVQHCTLSCSWCDTLEVWRKGNPYNVSEILDMFEKNDMVEKFKNGQHLILTGGSPLLQQNGLVELIHHFQVRFGFKPYIEVENEVMIMPTWEMQQIVDCWNNSPKLANSGMKEAIRYKTGLLRGMSQLKNSWFKFVVSSEKDWEEIDEYFLKPGLIKKEQLVLMPEGVTREELQAHYEIVVELAVKHNVRMTDRFHVTIWNKKTGV